MFRFRPIIMGLAVTLTALLACLPRARACSIIRPPPKLITKTVSTNEGILISSGPPGVEPIIRVVIKGDDGKHVSAEIVMDSIGGDRPLMAVLPREDWPAGRTLEVFVGETVPESELLSALESRDALGYECPSPVTRTYCVFWKQRFEVTVTNKADRVPPVLSNVGPLIWPHSGKTMRSSEPISAGGCGYEEAVVSQPGKATEFGPGSDVIVYALYLVPAGTKLPNKLPRLSLSAKTRSDYSEDVDWTRPHGFVAALPPDGLSELSIGKHMALSAQPRLTLPLGKEVCMVIRPLDLAGNEGKTLVSSCVELTP
ncbi:MAG: hypothetical protein GY854_25865 [Deltaproteobacteria bacterium]|nr:hypothetical protein [Deltaproteobacteria bacterium]